MIEWLRSHTLLLCFMFLTHIIAYQVGEWRGECANLHTILRKWEKALPEDCPMRDKLREVMDDIDSERYYLP